MTMLYFRASLWYQCPGTGFYCWFLVRVSLALCCTAERVGAVGTAAQFIQAEYSMEDVDLRGLR